MKPDIDNGYIQPNPPDNEDKRTSNKKPKDDKDDRDEEGDNDYDDNEDHDKSNERTKIRNKLINVRPRKGRRRHGETLELIRNRKRIRSRSQLKRNKDGSQDDD